MPSHTPQPAVFDMQIAHTMTHTVNVPLLKIISIKVSYLVSLSEKGSQKKMCIFGFAKPVTFVYERKHIIITSFNTKLWMACTQQVWAGGKKKKTLRYIWRITVSNAK